MNSIDRREFLEMAALAGIGFLAAGTVAAAKALDLSEKTVAELAASMQKGELTSEAITNWYLARIKTIDPKINSMIRSIPTLWR